MALGRTASAPHSEPKAYQFIEGRPPSRAAAADKENGSVVVLQADEVEALKAPPPALNKSVSEPFPSTPSSARIPLADLIGDAERTNHAQPQVESPQEHVQWQTVRSPVASQATTTPAPRAKKRAKSSSPPSSSSHANPKRQKSEKEPLDLNSMAKTLKTPMNDPATDLWNRYAVGNSKDTPLGLHAPAFSHLLDSSSPHVDDHTSGNVKGLRRWTSCGIEWPSSKTKRKASRPTTLNEQLEDDIFTDCPRDADKSNSQNKPSKINTMLERIQQSLLKDKSPMQQPSSSSPVPDRHETFDRKSISPIRAPELADIAQTRVIDAEMDTSESTSFGSDGLGSDVLDEVMRREEQNTVADSGLAKELASEIHVDNFDDEFGDSDEFDAGDFDKVIALCTADTTTGPSKAKTQKQEMQMQERLDSADDDQIFGFHDDDDDDDIDEATFVAAELAATQFVQSNTKQAKSSYTLRYEAKIHERSKPRANAIQRYLVKDVCESQYTNARGHKSPEKVLLVDVENSTEVSKTITLRDSWHDTRCTKGSYVHVIGEFDSLGQIFIDDTRNMLILHPDHLISALVVADSFDCTRRAVLQDRVKATSEASPPMVYGTMLHEIFQESLKASRWDDDFLAGAISKSITLHLEDLYEIKLTPEHVTEHLMSKMPAVQSWCEVFIKAAPDANAAVQDRNGKHVAMSVSKLLDVEEHIWSPMYGLKGNIDVTVQVTMKDDGGVRKLIAPLEVKTGKRATASHRAQTALYTLLLSDRYDVGIAYGVLYYMETSEISRVPAIRHELRHMIMQRNELACYVREKLSLPPMVKDVRKCNHCYAKTSCFLYHRVAENGDGETSGMRDKFDAVTKHLKPAHQEFFQKWDTLLTREESEVMKFRRELWTMLSSEREHLGRAFANVILEPGSGSEVQGTKINRYLYSFQKLEALPTFSFAESQLSVGEPIVVSDEQGHYALAKGYVTGVYQKRITVAVDRLLKNARTRLPEFDEEKNQVFSGITDSAGLQATASQAAPKLYRLDKDEFSNGMATVRNNLIQIMTEDVFGARKIRELVVDGRVPKFKPVSSAYNISGPQSQLNINEDQRGAIEKIMAAEDFALVLGMPGTGKTTTIAHIIRALVAKGKSILLTSYTHTAVDNILLKIRQDNISVLRLGALTKVHPEVREFAEMASEPRTSIEELRRIYHEPQVVATTCLGIGHRMFNERIFDYCIVDEASQITLPVCLGPIRMARAFVLVGDHFQLPPLVQNKAAQEGGLDVSLFKLLSETHPSAVATLCHQYRMNAPIMSISNALIYNGALICGTDEIAQSRLTLSSWSSAMKELHHLAASQSQSTCKQNIQSDCWLARVLDPASSSSVVFLDTDSLLPASLETQKASRITNTCEATLVTRLSRTLLLAGLPATSLGIITLYRSQLALVKSMLNSSEHAIPRHQATQIEAHTADRYQGRDKDVILLSCVRSNERACVGDLLKDWRRVNVAMTRARRKLIIIGSRGTLGKGDELLAKLVSLCDEHKWTISLPPSAAEDTAHAWSRGLATQDQDQGAMASPSRLPKSPPAPKRMALTESPATNVPKLPRTAAVHKPFKPPTMNGRMSAKAALGGAKIAPQSVLADIVNEIIPDGFFDD